MRHGSGSPIDNAVHLAGAEGPHRLGADIARCADLKQGGGPRLVVREFCNADEVRQFRTWPQELSTSLEKSSAR